MKPCYFVALWLVSFFAAGQSANAGPPAWWSTGNPPVVDPTAIPNNHGPANVGQAKWMAKNALAALRAVDDAIAATVETDLVGPGKIIPNWDPPVDAAAQAAQRAPLLIGQLKAMSAPFYQHLHEADPDWLAGQLNLNGTSHIGTHFPWSSVTTDDANKAVANIGQLKAVFSLRFETLEADLDQDGLADKWEILSFGSIAAYDGLADPDGDGVNNLVEFEHGLVAYQEDSDGDGYSDRLSLAKELHLKLDESSGLTAIDSSGQGRNGLLSSNAAWEPGAGIENGALEFNGGTDKVELAAGVLNGATDLTISLWFKTSSAPAGQTLLSSSAGTSSFPVLAIGIENGTTIRVDAGGGDFIVWNAGRNLANGLWHHLVVTRNAGLGEVALTLDGAPWGSSQAVAPGGLVVDRVALGQKHQSLGYDAAQAFTGLLDDVRVYSAIFTLPGPPGPGDPAYLTELFQPNDLDKDGLPDDWEVSCVGNRTKLFEGGDLDHDELNNRQEFEGGMNPADFFNGLSPVITLLSGGAQTIYNGNTTPDPLVFLVTNGSTPLANVPVELRHLEFLGYLKFTNGGSPGRSTTLWTDGQGKVSINFKAD